MIEVSQLRSYPGSPVPSAGTAGEAVSRPSAPGAALRGAGPVSAARSVPADPDESRRLPALSQARVIVSGKGGVRHPVVYGLDVEGRIVKVPLDDSAPAFLITVSG